MESCTGGRGGGGGRWRLRHVVPVVLLWMTLHRTVLGCSSTNCNMVLTEAQGEFTSPCYPTNYPNSQACKWTMQAPTGFIIQLSFLDFDLEEAPGCIYDRVVVNTGNTDVKFCGPTANGLTLNSTGNVMELSFTSDFSVQKSGFRVSFQHVAVALRNQKVSISAGNSYVTQISNSVSIPTLSDLTICFEVQRSSQKLKEWIFTYDSNNKVGLSLGSDLNNMKIIIDGVSCPIDTLIDPTDFTSTMKPFCVVWTSSSGRVSLYSNGEYWAKTCSSTAGHSVQGGGVFRLGGQQSFDGFIYNVRLWDVAMTLEQLKALTCDMVGNVTDWDNSHWTIPSGEAQTDATLSCTCYPHCIHLTTAAPTSGASMPNTPVTTSCTAPDCSVLPPITPSPSTIPTTSMPLTATISTTTTTTISSSTASSSSSSSAQQTTSSTSTVSSATTNHPDTNPPTHVSSATPPLTTTTNNPDTNTDSEWVPTPPPMLLTTNQPTTNIAVTTASSWERLFYSISFVVDGDGTHLALADVEQAVDLWLNVTFVNWNFTVYPDPVRVLQSAENPTSFNCQALLLHYYQTNQSLGKAALSAQLSSRKGQLDSKLNFQPDSTNIKLIENCPAEKTFHYDWPETKPDDIHYLPCFPNKDQNSSRKCVLDRQNLSSSWLTADISNCLDINSIQVSAENASEVAEQLADFTVNELSKEEVSKVVMKVKELMNVAKINSTLASTVVTIFSNVMMSSETALVSNSKTALKTVDELVQKLEFEGPSINITSKNLALGISTFNTSAFNGTTFSAFIAPNSNDPQVGFESKPANALGRVTLPASLLNSSAADRSSLSRISFMFFSSTNMFKKEQDGLALRSYVVASSVGNVSISNLIEPVVIEIAHLSEEPALNPVCMFWDFSMKDGAGGWNGDGCNVSKESSSNKTVCHCDHLTHFGILMDISGASATLSAKDNQILTFITYIGCGISAIFSAATLLTYIAFEKVRRDYPSKILMNLSTSLLFLNMVFLLDGWLASLDSEGLCLSIAIFLHYFLLTSFTWMGLESIHMYIALVKVFNTYIRRYILKFCLIGWGLPALLVAIIVSVDQKSYGRQDYGKEESRNGSSFCWIQNPVVFYTTCVGYFCLVFLLNVAMFVVVMMQICGRNSKRTNRTLREEVLRNLRSVVSLTFLLGMTWGFALFAWGPVTLAFLYLFTIFNSLQGLFIFIFHCALKENVQKQWRRYLCRGRFKMSDNSDCSKTATNNTKKVSSDNLGKSLSSSSFGSSNTNWTSKAKNTLNPFNKRHSNSDKCYSNQTIPKCLSSSPSSSTVEANSSSSSSSILPVSQMIDKVKDYCTTRSDNFYKNIIMSDSFANSTRF